MGRCAHGAGIRTALEKDLLLEYDIDVREVYYDIKDYVHDSPLPQIRNTDGEELEPTKLYYTLKCAPREAFNALKTLYINEDKDALLTDAGFDGKGQLVSVEFPWLKKGKREHGYWENTIMGNIVIDGAELTIDVNSRERAEAVRRKITRRLRKRAVFRNTLIESAERMLEEASGRQF